MNGDWTLDTITASKSFSLDRKWAAGWFVPGPVVNAAGAGWFRCTGVATETLNYCLE